MNFKLVLTSVILGCAFASVPACAVDSSAPDDTDAEAADEEAVASQDDLTAASGNLVGAFHGKPTSAPPTFQGLVFRFDGTFFGDLDTGIRCITAPCPSSAHLEGTYSATKSYLKLIAKDAASSNPYYGRYKYARSSAGLALSRKSKGTTWTQKLDKEPSYCAQPSDCGGQGIIHPMCAGGWTCSDSNTCGYSCGVPANDGVWPATATKLVAYSAGGGFVPPPPAGSTCGLGQRKYVLDRTTRVMSSEVCASTGTNKPLHLKTGTTTVTVAELAKIEKAMNAVKVATKDACGADKPYMQIKVTTPAGEKTYTDSFYRCQGGDNVYVDNISGVFTAMSDAL